MEAPRKTVAAQSAPAGRTQRWTLERVYDLFPRLRERRAPDGEHLLLAIGRALMGNPSLLLMDEPLEGLAPIIVEMLLKSLERLKREDSLAIVLVEQSARLALEFCGEALALDRGRVAYTGGSAALLADPQRLSALFVAQ